MSAVNPERLRELDEKQRAHNRALFLIGRIGIGFCFLIGLCSKTSSDNPIQTDHEVAAPTPTSTVIYHEFPAPRKAQ
ncbi:MAG: hypothetical protein JOZ08_09260 [Verrucomicrobia bacterium]|nr:hypothetical protein [Verrucomicrobiota bacterium]MBV8273880.1 hypothetical protein [Verrucomicrobiota bacterium]